MDLFRHIFAFDPQTPLLFTQFYFWAFFAIVYALFSLLHSKRLLRNAFLFFVSLFFYYKTSGLFVLILLFVTASDFLIAKRIYHAQNTPQPPNTQNRKAKAWLVLSIVIDLSLLCYFKYSYFLTNMVNDLFGSHLQVFDLFAYIGNGFQTTGHFDVDRIVLPVGISFYIFQVISYTADVYYRKIKPVSNLLDFGFYVSFFPQLVAGPIVRASEFIPQLYKPFFLSRKQFGLAVFWILNGLIKKVILSDYLAVNFIDRVFDNPLLFTGFENLFAIFAYSLQVYADFSGYTDIAIGVAMLMGFYLPQNFNSPYKATNPHNFWKRWHMSLSRWLQAYLYIPLGGNRKATFGTYFWIALIALIALILSGSWVAFGVVLALGITIALVAFFRPDRRRKLYANLNSFITMLLGGLWHGASWNFMIWGGLNGIGMIIYKAWKELNWHFRIALTTLVWLALGAWKIFAPMPVANLFFVWMTFIEFGTLVRYLNFLFTRTACSDAYNRFQTRLGNAWGIAQTFVFITFTRLFFRSGSNLDPATANHEAWQTAQQMVQQMGSPSAWDASLMPTMLSTYAPIIVLFVIGMVIHWLPDRFKRWYRINFALLPKPVMALAVVAVVFFIYQFMTAQQQPFIYFQF